MGYSVYVTGKPASGEATDADAKALSEALAPYLNGLEWAVESFSPDPEFSLHDGEWNVATKVGYDLDALDVQLAQILALARVASRVRPDWTFEVSDDLDILEGDDDGGIVVHDGTFVSGAESAEGYLHSELEFADDGTFRAPDLGDFDIEIDTSFLDDEEPDVDPSDIDHTPFAHTERFDAEPLPHHATVSSFSVETKAPDSDGDTKVVVAAIVFNALAESAEVGVDVDLYDADNALLTRVSASETGPFHEGQRISFGGRDWLKGRGAPEGVSVGLSVWRTEAKTVAVGRVVPAFEPPDSDGDVRYNVVFEIVNDGPAWGASKARWYWLDDQGERTGESDYQNVDMVPSGLSTVEGYDYLREDGKHNVGRAVFVELELGRRHTRSVIAGHLPQVRLRGAVERTDLRSPDRPPAPTAEAPVAEPTAPSPPPADDPPPSDAPADIDALLAGDAADIVTALMDIRARVEKRFATRVRGLLRHEDASVRAEAARCLAAIGGPSLVIPLRALLQDSDDDVRSAAQAAIATLQP